ncbi:anti-anti-sigma factor [Catenuloplanes nepalensis]|uniref:Anti-anti-sigma factor n=1 Tax=Catenuloplanes nepalensis TaxID=587533 RepID=A0ABT9N7C8_9ACTN|nr:STAS domain-containing protein [Catenuloplanes nepalensis]MDP9799428.1 anti-anti-sigma factor [Catenuloplanes nepalensis]
MPTVRCDIESVGTRLLVRVHGELSIASAPAVRTALLKCLVDQPDAVVVDLAETVVTDSAAVSVFLGAVRQASLWPGTPLLLAAPGRELARLLARTYPRLAVHRSVQDALAAPPQQRTPIIKDTLLPVGGAGRRARELVAEACLSWDLPHLLGPASVVAVELVTNAVVHAQTMIDVRITLGRRYLVVAVRDGSEAAPVLPPPASANPADMRGLLLVKALAYRWGTSPLQGGKVVWATLRRHEPSD